MKTFNVLGVDPGTRRIGYGVIEVDGSRLKLVDAGIFKIKSKDDAGALLETKEGIDLLIKKFKPKIVAVEKLYFVKNQKTGMGVAQARGVIMLSALESGISVKEYGPNEVKMGITGYGLADKKSIFKMVKLILGVPGINLIDDASDALAVAIVASRPS
ncbi:MAG: crossover junction endodeoxyribonuclease RuvC [Patescibacteria group bacterium]